MNILVVGGGGREHAIISKIRMNPKVDEIYCLPGNGGIARIARTADISAKDVDATVAFAKSHSIDYAIVAQDDPLVLGMVDALNNAGIPAFGPTKKAARIEGSKTFAKELMKRHGIPTANYESFSNPTDAMKYIEANEPPYVIKADGLALGKGVTIAATRGEAASFIQSAMIDRVFGESGKSIIIEECLTGPEASILMFTDGETYRLMPSSMDHKRALDGDNGANTGGMGVVAPNPYVTPDMLETVERTIIQPTLAAMRERDSSFSGCLYVGIMITNEGLKVIEYNCRFGDPEAQAVLSLLESDLLDIMLAVTNKTLSTCEVNWKSGSACCVVVASEGYPKAYATGFPISRGDMPSNVRVDYAGVKARGDELVTSGGRVLSVTATAGTLREAIDEAYQARERVAFNGAYSRSDIGKKALKAGG